MKDKMKKISILLVLVLMATILAGCNSADTKQKTDENTKKQEETKTDQAQKAEKTETDQTKSAEAKVKIGFASYSYSDKWQSYLNDAVNAKCQELGIELVVSDGKGDAATQLNNVENAIAGGVKAIIISMVDPTAPAPFINACQQAGIPLIAVNRYFDGAQVFIGSDDVYAGNIQAEFVVEKLDSKGNVAILMGELGNDSTEKRTKGNKEILAKYPDMKIVYEEVGKWDRAKGMEIAENWLSTGQKIDAIISNNDEMAIGAINALKGLNMNDQVIVAGVDATVDALPYVQDKTLDVTVFQNPFQQGGVAVETAVKLIDGEKIEGYVDVPFEKVDIDNVEKYVKMWE